MRKEKSFTFLVTGVKNNDYAVKKLVGLNDSYMFYKLAYTPPYQNFSGIREFQVKSRFRPFEDATKQKKYAVVDLAEWIGHEREEYLEVFMKFLHDYSDYFRFEYIFTVGSADRNQIKELLLLASTYLEDAQVLEDLTMVDVKKMAKYLQVNYMVDRTCAARLAEIFVKNRIDGYPQLHMLMDEAAKYRGVRRAISEEYILEKPEMKKTKLYMIFEKDIERWREERERQLLNKCG